MKKSKRKLRDFFHRFQKGAPSPFTNNKQRELRTYERLPADPGRTRMIRPLQDSSLEALHCRHHEMDTCQIDRTAIIIADDDTVSNFTAFYFFPVFHFFSMS